MNAIVQQDLNTFENILEKTKQQGIDFLNNIENIPTSNTVSIDPNRALNELGLGSLDALKEFNERLAPLIVSSSGPRYWGFVTGGSTPASIVGDWLAAVYDQNTQSIKAQGGASALIEFETINLLLQLLDLPNSFLGGFVTGATMSNFTCLGVARQWFGKQFGKDFAKKGISETINILTATPHSSSVKTLSMLGIGSQNYTTVKTIEGNREAIDIADLEKTIAALNGQPFLLISSAGTVNTADFDDFEAIANLRQKHTFWWHIDAAFGGFAAVSDKFKHLVKGWEEADSITVDCHKWLNVPYDSAFYLIKKEHADLQIETFQNSNAPYLGNPLENFNYLNVLPENSRRLRALPVWFSLLAYGKEGFKDVVENSVALALHFGNALIEEDVFELLAPIRLNNVCFTLKGDHNEEKVTEFLRRLNDRGKVFMTPTFYNGRKGIRASFVNWRTKENDIAIVIEEMKAVLVDLKM
ncbi:pyridoxal-dependent decarboxylase [Flavobacterium sp. Fl-77]|uniref:Pyridoxal-dependent decarboxylase n=1 Tax=Flavobacterium flavipigmentatum TaxID=2893884 RepID=A0AAJ2S9K8_9FLAO|nr:MULTISPECIES: pyridoxal-dependent decarboxylase [unclassified Flavobacterium]MDX6181397.1 pyridoxal-dependent decarboxylase [Flavobacterium sp. Fl-33]MDX6184999.1 pyridoxal-dependent decarboxylase [Flavobacterium sp. Fl-77]UFH40090.1 pyridoxal-dependent decarboxylase [Flavobacterium sp. F-70]